MHTICKWFKKEAEGVNGRVEFSATGVEAYCLLKKRNRGKPTGEWTGYTGVGAYCLQQCAEWSEATPEWFRLARPLLLAVLHGIAWEGMQRPSDVLATVVAWICPEISATGFKDQMWYFQFEPPDLLQMDHGMSWLVRSSQWEVDKMIREEKKWEIWA